ncbi:methyltransferase domain-containing protein [Flavisolibacter sp. BT320]|nr:methyltransferase domain-containing protein [Flavisolibacter longurius]
MPSFQKRSYQKELLDSNGIPFADIRQNMEELDLINRYLGGHAITVAGLKALLNEQSLPYKKFTVAEIGCGGGDNLRAIKDWASLHKIPVQLTGIDLNEECISYAANHPKNKDIDFIHSDYRQASFSAKPDVVFSSLFCHHFTDEELVAQLQWMRQNSVVGFFINDLHRHPLAYYSIKGLTAVLSKSYLVKNDAPLSVQRGFKKKDWTRIFAKAGIERYRCQWRWAFRWLLTCHTHA